MPLHWLIRKINCTTRSDKQLLLDNPIGSDNMALTTGVGYQIVPAAWAVASNPHQICWLCFLKKCPFRSYHNLVYSLFQKGIKDSSICLLQMIFMFFAPEIATGFVQYQLQYPGFCTPDRLIQTSGMSGLLFGKTTGASTPNPNRVFLKQLFCCDPDADASKTVSLRSNLRVSLFPFRWPLWVGQQELAASKCPGQELADSTSFMLGSKSLREVSLEIFWTLKELPVE